MTGHGVSKCMVFAVRCGLFEDVFMANSLVDMYANSLKMFQKIITILFQEIDHMHAIGKKSYLTQIFSG